MCTITYAHIKNHCILIGAQVTGKRLQRRLICLAGKLSTLSAHSLTLPLLVLLYIFLNLMFDACRVMSFADTLASSFTALLWRKRIN